MVSASTIDEVEMIRVIRSDSPGPTPPGIRLSGVASRTRVQVAQGLSDGFVQAVASSGTAVLAGSRQSFRE
jgi:hypothetical protein